jgi:hypothetical protein
MHSTPSLVEAGYPAGNGGTFRTSLILELTGKQVVPRRRRDHHSLWYRSVVSVAGLSVPPIADRAMADLISPEASQMAH